MNMRMDVDDVCAGDLDSGNIDNELNDDPDLYQANYNGDDDTTLSHAPGDGKAIPGELLSLPSYVSDNISPQQPKFSGRRLLAHFLALRKNEPVTSIKPLSPPPPSPPTSIIDVVEDEQPPLPQVPPRLVDNNTLELPPTWPRPLTQHRYLASISFVQKRAIVSQLTSPEICAVVLVERISLGGPDLILDPHVAMLYLPLEQICVQATEWSDRLCELSWAYTRIVVVFEAYPSSYSYTTMTTTNSRRISEKGLPNVYTPPVNAAIKKLKRTLAFAEGTNAKSVGCKIDLVFAKDPGEAARFARVLGDLLDGGGGGQARCVAVWDKREWLYDDAFEVCAVLGGVSVVAERLAGRTRRILRVCLG